MNHVSNAVKYLCIYPCFVCKSIIKYFQLLYITMLSIKTAKNTAWSYLKLDVHKICF